MPPSMEPIESFTYLVDNIPQWLTKVEDLNTRCDEQYDRFYKLTKHGEVKLTRKKKNDSTESLRPKDTTTVPFLQIDDTKGPTPVLGVTSNGVPVSKPKPHSDAAAHLPSSASRTLKRKPTSALSAVSGKDGYRTKSMIVVYYDSAIQEGFESIVKQISNARNSVRKGRTTATFQTRMASMGLPSVNSDTSPSAKFMMPSIGRTKESAADKQKFKVYDESDRHLEEAQNLSERAAHQFLRDGDCIIEIEAIKKRIRTVQHLATKELERLKKESEVSSEEPEAVPLTNEQGIEQIVDRIYPSLPTPPPSTAPIEVTPPPPKQIHFVATGAIEVDDASSDSSSIKIDMNAIRRVTRRMA